MPRPLIITVLCAIALLPVSLEAQYRGAGHRGGFPPPTGTVVVTGRVTRAGAPYALQPAPFFQPFVYSPPIYTSPYVWVQETRSHYSDQVNELSNQVERLTREVQRLREDRQIPPEPPPPNEEKSTPTVLVFRDGHRQEIQNYAIVGTNAMGSGRTDCREDSAFGSGSRRYP